MLYTNAQEIISDAQATSPDTEAENKNYSCSCDCDVTDCESDSTIHSVEDYYEIIKQNEGNSKIDIAQLAASELPSSVDNSTSPYFPEIGMQLNNSCVAFSITHYVFTYTMNKERGVPTTPENTFSTKFVYNLSNEGQNGAAGVSECFNVLSSIGCPTIKSFPNAEDPISWATEAEIWREAFNYRLKWAQNIENVGTDETQISSPDDPDLQAIKTALSNGDVLRFSSHISGWHFDRIKTNENAPENDKFANEEYLKYISYVPVGHSMAIVGYNDDIWCDINDNDQIDDGEMGALKIANNWGTNWANDGFCWIAYDAFNKTSSVDGVEKVEGRIADIYGVQRIDVFKPTDKPEIYVKFTLDTSDRTQFEVNFFGERSGEQHEGKFLKDIDYTVETNKWPFIYTYPKQTTGTFAYALRDTIPSLSNYMFNYSEISMTIKDTKEDDKPLIVKDITLVNEYTGEEYKITDDLPITLNGSEYSVDLKKKSVLISYIGFDNPILHYKIGDSDFVEVPMKESLQYRGYLYKYFFGDTSDEITLYFSDENGNIDDNNGEYYKAGVGMNYFRTENQRDKLQVNDLYFANGTPDVGKTKQCLFGVDFSGGYSSYSYKYVVRNLENGEVEVLDYDYDFDKRPFYFDTAGTYEITAHVKDWAGDIATITKVFEVENHPFEIASLTCDKEKIFLSDTIEFKSETLFEYIYSYYNNNSNFVVKNSKGDVVWEERKTNKADNKREATSTARFTYRPSRAGEYTLTVSSKDFNGQKDEKTIPFTVLDKIIGDSNSSGDITIVDATNIQCYLAQIISDDDINKELSDCDNGSDIDIMDATYIQMYLAKNKNCCNVGEVIEFVPKTYTVTFIDKLGWGEVNCEMISIDPDAKALYPGLKMTPIGVDGDDYTIFTVEVPERVQTISFNTPKCITINGVNCMQETLRINYTGGEKTYYAIGGELGLYQVHEA